MNDAVEFNHWVDRVRERTTAMACVALESLARAASARGDHTLAVATWRVRADIDPLDAGPAMALMEALAASGDRAGSIRHAQAYQKLIRDELDMEADPRVNALANRFRRETPVGTPVVVTPATPPSPRNAIPVMPDAVAEQVVSDDSGLVKEATEKRRRRASAVIAGLAVGLIGIAGALWSRSRRRKADD